MASDAESAAQSPLPPEVVAVIDLGASAARIVIAEFDGETWKVLDQAEQPLALGRDVFTEGLIRRTTMADALRVLTQWQEMLASYPLKNVMAIGTSALREAANRDTFLDRVLLRTGIRVRVIEGVETNRLTYLAVRDALDRDRPEILRGDTAIIEIGGGSTELMLLRGGDMVSARTLPIGVTRMRQELEWRAQDYLPDMIRENLHSTLQRLQTEVSLADIDNFVALGSDARLMAQRIGTVVGAHSRVISATDFGVFVRRLEGMTVDQIVNRMELSYTDATALQPALITLMLFFEQTAAESVVVPQVSIRDGVLLDYSSGSDSLRREFMGQTMASAMTLLQRYRGDVEHSRQVTDLALRLFDQLSDEHGMGERYRQLLEVAGILHDIGTFISARSHHKHGAYVVRNSEIFGMERDDIEIVANVVRYHRSAKPKMRHPEFAALNSRKRMAVQKLAAILRVADALDRGHGGRIHEFTIEQAEPRLFVHSHVTGDLSLERRSLKRKGDLFEDVFGLSVVLR